MRRISGLALVPLALVLWAAPAVSVAVVASPTWRPSRRTRSVSMRSPVSSNSRIEEAVVVTASVNVSTTLVAGGVGVVLLALAAVRGRRYGRA